MMKRTKTEFSILKAFHGDSILIKTFDEDNNEYVILIDGGTSSTFRYSLKKVLTDISRIDLLVLTHTDSDHIGGLIKFFKSELINEIEINEIWMNNPDLYDVDTGHLISTAQGDNLKNLILQKIPDVEIRQISTADQNLDHFGLEFTILSPTLEIVKEFYSWWQNERPKEVEHAKTTKIANQTHEYAESLEELSRIPFAPQKRILSDLANASSISFLLKCPDVSLLLLADSRAEIISAQLRELGFNEENQLRVDYIKVSHHGSKNNTSHKLLGLVNSKNYLISTNGSSNNKHPSRETIARIVCNPFRTEEHITIHFNYQIEEIKNRIGDFITDEDLLQDNWSAKFNNIFNS